eukprot:SM000004S14999  [mRNA]  locus=s4:588718:592509:- [translate_table: standard]
MHEAFAAAAAAARRPLLGVPGGGAVDARGSCAFWRKLYAASAALRVVQWWRGGQEMLRHSSLLVDAESGRAAAREPLLLGRVLPTGRLLSVARQEQAAEDNGKDFDGDALVPDPHGGWCCAQLIDQRTVALLDPVARTGHSLTAVGCLQVIIGGLSREGGSLIDVLILDTSTMRLWRPSVEFLDGCSPAPRFRHTSTLVAAKEGCTTILMLGGYNVEGEEFGAQDTFCLDVLNTGARVRWSATRTTGDVPPKRFYHTACALNGGRNVVVYGGEGSAVADEVTDGEAATAADAGASAMPAPGMGNGGGGRGRDGSTPSPRQMCVYLLDVGTLRWQQLPTRGPGPGSRSLHVACIHRCPSTGHDRLIVTSGFVETNCELADMRAYALDLTTLQWEHGPGPEAGSSLPNPRHRSSCMKVGPDLLLVVGGAGQGMTAFLDDIQTLDLRTLAWRKDLPVVHGRPSLGPTAGHSSENLVIFGGCTVAAKPLLYPRFFEAKFVKGSQGLLPVLAGNMGIVAIARMEPLLLGYWGEEAGGASDSSSSRRCWSGSGVTSPDGMSSRKRKGLAAINVVPVSRSARAGALSAAAAASRSSALAGKSPSTGVPASSIHEGGASNGKDAPDVLDTPALPQLHLSC